MDEDPSAGDGNRRQPKKTKLSSDHVEATSSAVENQKPNGESQQQLLPLSSSSTAADANRVESEIQMSESTLPKDVDDGAAPADCTPIEISYPQQGAVGADAVLVTVEPSSVDNPIATESQQTEQGIARTEPAGTEAAVSLPTVSLNLDGIFTRNIMGHRRRNYRLRADSSGSERAEEESTQMEGILRSLADQMSHEMINNDGSDDGGEGNEGNANDNDDDDTAASSDDTTDSDDSDSAPSVSTGDDDDDDDDDSSRDDGSDNNANEQVDIANMPFMQTANAKSNWNYFQEIQLRSLGLSYRTKASIGGVQYNSKQFQSRAYGSKHLAERLSMLHRLRKHDGCVNSLNFNSSGALLASGSDDLKINIWNWQNNKLVHSIGSGHRSNVFQTKFIDASGYRDEIEIVSTGRDGEVRHTRVGPAGEIRWTLLFKQNQPIHKIAIPARSPFEFLTACEDGIVKSWDLRDNVAKRVTNVKKRLYSISTHPLDNEFCVSGNNEHVGVYDRRNASKPVKCHYAAHTKANTDYLTVTCAVYNNTGTEILASYSDEDVFLFDNVNHEDGKYLHKYSGHCNTKTIKGVNFFGPQSEFVVSGSDCGNIFIWDKESEVIVNWMKGDDTGVVNCLEPHPEFPILATSGLDSDAKIWVPKGPDDEQEIPAFPREALEKCVRRNLRIRRSNRCSSFSEDQVLDFLMFSRQGIGGSLRRHYSSDSEDQADGDGNGGGSGGGGNAGRRGSGEREDDADPMILRCAPS